MIRQPLCPVVGRRPQHAVSKLPCLVFSSAISCRSSICPGRLSIAWLVSLVVFSCHMVSNWWHARSIGHLWGSWYALPWVFRIFKPIPYQNVIRPYNSQIINNPYKIREIRIMWQVCAYIVENSETFQKIYSFMHFKWANFVSLMPIAYQIGKKWSIWPVSEPPLLVPACCMGKVLIIIKLFTILSII